MFCGVDWVATGQFLSGLGTLLGAVFVFVAALMAREKFNDWAEKQSFKSNRDHAIKILVAFEKARFALKEIRSPIRWPREIESAKKLLEENNVSTSDKYVTAQIMLDRIASKSDEWEQVFISLPIAKVLFSSDARDQLFEIIMVRQQIIAAVHAYTTIESDMDLKLKFEGIFWLGDPENDALLKRLSAADDQLGTILSPYIIRAKAS